MTKKIKKTPEELAREICAELKSYTGKRLTARSIGDEAHVAEIIREVIIDGGKRDHLIVKHGGSVGGSYNYPAQTECLVIAANPRGQVIWCAGRMAACRVTHSGVLATMYGDEFRPLADRRYGAAKRNAAKSAMMRLISHSNEWVTL